MTDELVADRLYRLDLGMVNAYLVDAGETTLVDAGTPNAADDLRGELDEAGYDGYVGAELVPTGDADASIADVVDLVSDAVE